MASNEPDGTEFTLLGSYLPQDAQKLLERLDQAGIAFRTRPTMPFPQPGPSTTLVIGVDSARSSEANQILRDLFGDNLPNYDSSFFRGHHNV
jgi:extradiol dioxygenase family protein